ncbi:MAG: alpha/beta hydrolase [Pseudomonadota bacterium]
MLHHMRRFQADGPMVVFLHAGGVNSWMWEAIVAETPERAAMDRLMIDLPGHGESARAAWRSLGAAAAAVEQVIDAARGDKEVALVGLSLGGYVALTLLSRKPAAYAAALVSGVHAGGMTRRWLMRAVAAAMAPLTPRPFFARRTAKMLGVAEHSIDRFVEEAGKTRPASIRRAVIDVIDFEAPPALAACEARLLVACGGREHPLVKSAPVILRRLVRNCSAYEAAGLGHGWPAENPAQFVRLLGDHLSGGDLLGGHESGGAPGGTV